MYTVSCKDMGAKDCEFIAHGQTPAETKEAMVSHANEVHSDWVTSMGKEKFEQFKLDIDKYIKEA